MPAVPIQPSHKTFTAPSLSTILLLLWLAGIAASLAYQIFAYRAFRRYIKRRGEPVTDSGLIELFIGERAIVGVRREITLLCCKGLKLPTMMGFFKPQLLLPAVGYDEDDMPLIIRHELTHFKRVDLWYKTVARTDSKIILIYPPFI